MPSNLATVARLENNTRTVVHPANSLMLWLHMNKIAFVNSARKRRNTATTRKPNAPNSLFAFVTVILLLLPRSNASADTRARSILNLRRCVTPLHLLLQSTSQWLLHRDPAVGKSQTLNCKPIEQTHHHLQHAQLDAVVVLEVPVHAATQLDVPNVPGNRRHPDPKIGLLPTAAMVAAAAAAVLLPAVPVQALVHHPVPVPTIPQATVQTITIVAVAVDVDAGNRAHKQRSSPN